MTDYSLHLGDCLELMRDIPDGKIDLTVTSPPYDNLRIYNGNISQWSFEKFQAIAKELFRITAEGGSGKGWHPLRLIYRNPAAWHLQRHDAWQTGQIRRREGV